VLSPTPLPILTKVPKMRATPSPTLLKPAGVREMGLTGIIIDRSDGRDMDVERSSDFAVDGGDLCAGSQRQRDFQRQLHQFHRDPGGTGGAGYGAAARQYNGRRHHQSRRHP